MKKKEGGVPTVNCLFPKNSLIFPASPPEASATCWRNCFTVSEPLNPTLHSFPFNVVTTSVPAAKRMHPGRRGAEPPAQRFFDLGAGKGMGASPRLATARSPCASRKGASISSSLEPASMHSATVMSWARLKSSRAEISRFSSSGTLSPQMHWPVAHRASLTHCKAAVSPMLQPILARQGTCVAAEQHWRAPR